MRRFLKERSSWILFILLSNLFYLLIAYLDTTISFTGALYGTTAVMLSFLFFLLVRYTKESRFYTAVSEVQPTTSLEEIQEFTLSPHEEVVLRVLEQHRQYAEQKLQENTIQLEQEKDDILAWIHEVKTPLTAMQLIIEQVEDPKRKNTLYYEWLRIHLLLDQQLHQKRLGLLENDLFMEKVAIAPVFHEEITLLRSWCYQKRIGFELQLDAVEVLTDAKWLAFLLRQLLTNSVKYSEQSTITVTSKKEDDHVIITVQDQGKGISERDLPRIFDKGFTSTSNKTAASTGMGLYLAKKIATELKIQLHIDSTVGKGTSVHLTFPKENDMTLLFRK